MSASPAEARVPAHRPDAAEVRRDRAQSDKPAETARGLLMLDELLAARPEAVAARTDRIEALPRPGDQGKEVNPRAKEYPARLKATIIERLAGRE